MQSSRPATSMRREERSCAEGGATPRWTWRASARSSIRGRAAWTPPATSPRLRCLRSVLGSSRVRWCAGARRAAASAPPPCVGVGTASAPRRKASEAERLLGAWAVSRARSKDPPQERRQQSSTLEAGAGPTEECALRAATVPSASSSAIAPPKLVMQEATPVVVRSAAALETVGLRTAVHAAAPLAIGSLRAP